MPIHFCNDITYVEPEATEKRQVNWRGVTKRFLPRLSFSLLALLTGRDAVIGSCPTHFISADSAEMWMHKKKEQDVPDFIFIEHCLITPKKYLDYY